MARASGPVACLSQGPPSTLRCVGPDGSGDGRY
jgi:hypothetical protein